MAPSIRRSGRWTWIPPTASTGTGWGTPEALYVDGSEVVRMPFQDLFVRSASGNNVMFEPNAGHREGRMHVMKFGYRIGSTEEIFGPARK